ncbi:hypothetical protein GCM10010521_24790 [Streptomyces rameus]|uniref:Uncharacterized protein n=1 Tax=Streptomyces rameus TaxID=68261 RepID=A0ABP6N638_9ACTN
MGRPHAHSGFARPAERGSAATVDGASGGEECLRRAAIVGARVLSVLDAASVEPGDTSVQIRPRERRVRAGNAFESGGRDQISLGRKYVTSWGRFAVPLVCHGSRPALPHRVGTGRPGR